MILRQGMDGLEKFMLRGKKRKIFGIWLLISLLAWIIFTPFIALGVLISGLTTVFIWNYKDNLRRKILRLRISPKWKFIWIGTLGALWVETEFWVIAKVFDVGISASDNLLIDFFFTIPWYFIMMVFFWKVQTKYNYSLYSILILGGVYSWFIEGFFKFLIGDVPLNELVLFSLTFPGNVLSYSAIVLPASFLLRKEILDKAGEGKKKWIYALLPILAVVALIPVIAITAIFSLS